MSGLIALFDDVAGIAKVAAASVDDVAGQAARAGVKAAGAVIDDAAVTPKYVHGFDASREIPIIWRIAKGSAFNKIVILLPVALLLSAFAPQAISPLLMLGGAYLCFEGAEKVWHAFLHQQSRADSNVTTAGDPVNLEEIRIAGAIKTDFILSAEIMTIALSTIPLGDALWTKSIVLCVVALGITTVVYGSVALIVKADDLGLHLAAHKNGPLAAFGRWLVRIMPTFMKTLTIVGTAAMLWVGGDIIIHGLHEMGQHQPHEWIHHQGVAISGFIDHATGLVQWVTTAFFDGIFGMTFGLLLVPVATWVINPLIQMVTGESPRH